MVGISQETRQKIEKAVITILGSSEAQTARELLNTLKPYSLKAPLSSYRVGAILSCMKRKGILEHGLKQRRLNTYYNTWKLRGHA